MSMAPPVLRIKDLLRDLRSGMTAGRVAITPLRQDAPWPVRGLVNDLFEGMDFFASRLEAASSHLAHQVFDSAEPVARRGERTLDWLVLREGGDLIFAQLAYGALGAAHRRFSQVPVLISETAAAEAFSTAVTQVRDDRACLPGELLHRLLSGRVIRPNPFEAGSGDISDSRRLAAISLVLLLCVERAEGSEDGDLLDLCCDTAAHVDGRIDLQRDARRKVSETILACARMI